MDKPKLFLIKLITSLLHDFNVFTLSAVYKALLKIKEEGDYGLHHRNN